MYHVLVIRGMRCNVCCHPNLQCQLGPQKTVCLNSCAIEEFKRSSDSWRSHAKTTAALRSEFAELLGDAEEPAQHDQAAQPAHSAQHGPGKQHNASKVTSSQLPAGQPEVAEAPKPKKAKKKVSKQPLHHDAAGKPDKQDNSTAPEDVSGKPKKRQKGAKAPAMGSAPAAAGPNPAEHAGVDAQTEPKHVTDGPAAKDLGPMIGAGSKLKNHKEKGGRNIFGRQQCADGSGEKNGEKEKEAKDLREQQVEEHISIGLHTKTM